MPPHLGGQHYLQVLYGSTYTVPQLEHQMLRINDCALQRARNGFVPSRSYWTLRNSPFSLIIAGKSNTPRDPDLRAVIVIIITVAIVIVKTIAIVSSVVIIHIVLVLVVFGVALVVDDLGSIDFVPRLVIVFLNAVTL